DREAMEPADALEGGQILDRIAALGQGGVFRQPLRARADFLAIGGNEFRFSVVPRTFADPVDGVDGRPSLARRSPEVGAPRVITGAFRDGERLAMRVGLLEVGHVSVLA